MRELLVGMIVALFVCAPVRGGVEDVTIDDLGWLVGEWHGSNEQMRWEEHWSTPAAGGMVGMFRMLRGDELVTYELVLIEENDGRIEYYLRHFGREMEAWEDGPLTFDLIEATEDVMVFEANKAQEGPTYIRYDKVGADRVKVWVGATREVSDEGFALEITRKE